MNPSKLTQLWGVLVRIVSALKRIVKSNSNL